MMEICKLARALFAPKVRCIHVPGYLEIVLGIVVKLVMRRGHDS